MSEMRPKRASSWNINLMALPCAQSLRISASASGSFFPLVLRLWIALRVALVGSKLSPVMAVQQVVSRGQRHLAAQALVQRRPDLANDEYPAGSGLLEKRCQELALFLQRHVLPFSPTSSRASGAPAMSPCMKRRRNWQAQPRDTPSTWAVSAKLKPCASGKTTACAWRSCSTVFAEAMAWRALLRTLASPLAGRDITFSINADEEKLFHQ
jgi:hypothetical protein